MLEWIDKQDGVSDVLAEDINEIAHAVQENSSDIEEANSVLLSKADKPKKAVFNDIGTVTLADNTIYYAEEISQLSNEYPEGDFMCSLTFTLSDIEDLDVTVTLPGTSKYIGGTPTFAKGETWELNIKNGVVVGGLVK